MDIQIWVRYIRAKLDKQVIDFSAVSSLTKLAISSPKDYLVSLLVSALSSESEGVALTMLHTMNLILTNLRLSVGDNSDAEFLGKLLDYGLPVMEGHLSKNWKNWGHMLGRTLAEWKLYYKVESRLSNRLTKLVASKERELINMKNEHYSLVSHYQKLADYLKKRNSETISNHLIRVLSVKDYYKNKHSFCAFSYREVESAFLNLSKEYINNNDVLFKSIANDKSVFVFYSLMKMYSAGVLEYRLGPSIRNLIEEPSSDIADSHFVQNKVTEIVRGIIETLENLHSLVPELARYLTKICSIIKTKNYDFWNNISNLLLHKLFKPAISSPILFGICDFVPESSAKTLELLSFVIEQIWLGPLDDVEDMPWLLTEMPIWRHEIRQAFMSMYSQKAKRTEHLVLPDTLIISDLGRLKLRMKDYEWTKCPSIRKYQQVQSGDPRNSVGVQTTHTQTNTACQTDDTDEIESLKLEILAYKRKEKEYEQSVIQLNEYWSTQFRNANQLAMQYKEEVEDLNRQLFVTKRTSSDYHRLNLKSELRSTVGEETARKQADPINYFATNSFYSARESREADRDFKRRVEEVLSSIKR